MLNEHSHNFSKLHPIIMRIANSGLASNFPGHSMFVFLAYIDMKSVQV